MKRFDRIWKLLSRVEEKGEIEKESVMWEFRERERVSDSDIRRRGGGASLAPERDGATVQNLKKKHYYYITKTLFSLLFFLISQLIF